jgi:hypothetical protein
MAPSATTLEGERVQSPPPRSLLPSMTRPPAGGGARPSALAVCLDTTVTPPPDSSDAPVIAVAPHGASGCQARPSREASATARAPRARVPAAAPAAGARRPGWYIHPLGSPIRTENKIHFYERTAGDEPQRTDARRTRDGRNQIWSTLKTIPAPWNDRRSTTLRARLRQTMGTIGSREKDKLQDKKA